MCVRVLNKLLMSCMFVPTQALGVSWMGNQMMWAAGLKPNHFCLPLLITEMIILTMRVIRMLLLEGVACGRRGQYSAST